MNSKKGSVRDVVLVAILLFAMSVAVFISFFVANTMYDGMLDIPTINESSSANLVLNAAKEVTHRFDYVIFGLFIALTLGMITTSWLIGGYPIFMFLYFLVVIFAVALSAVLANTWETISQASVFGTTITFFPLTNHLMSYLPIYVSIIGIIGLVTMFIRPFVSGGSQ